jgi:hypothetical protein
MSGRGCSELAGVNHNSLRHLAEAKARWLPKSIALPGNLCDSIADVESFIGNGPDDIDDTFAG